MVPCEKEDRVGFWGTGQDVEFDMGVLNYRWLWDTGKEMVIIRGLEAGRKDLRWGYRTITQGWRLGPRVWLGPSKKTG